MLSDLDREILTRLAVDALDVFPTVPARHPISRNDVPDVPLVLGFIHYLGVVP